MRGPTAGLVLMMWVLGAAAKSSAAPPELESWWLNTTGQTGYGVHAALPEPLLRRRYCEEHQRISQANQQSQP